MCKLKHLGVIQTLLTKKSIEWKVLFGIGPSSENQILDSLTPFDSDNLILLLYYFLPRESGWSLRVRFLETDMVTVATSKDLPLLPGYTFDYQNTLAAPIQSEKKFIFKGQFYRYLSKLLKGHWPRIQGVAFAYR